MCHDLVNCGADLPFERPDTEDGHPLFPRQLGHAIQERRWVGARPRTTACPEGAPEFLRISAAICCCVWLICSVRRWRSAATRRSSAVSSRHFDNSKTRRSDEYERDQDPARLPSRAASLEPLREQDADVQHGRGPLGGGPAGLISQLLSWKRLFTAGSRMRPAMNCATSSSGGLPGRIGVTASMRTVFSTRPEGAPALEAHAGALLATSTVWNLSVEGICWLSVRQHLAPSDLPAGFLAQRVEVGSQEVQTPSPGRSDPGEAAARRSDRSGGASTAAGSPRRGR